MRNICKQFVLEWLFGGAMNFGALLCRRDLTYSPAFLQTWGLDCFSDWHFFDLCAVDIFLFKQGNLTFNSFRHSAIC